MTGKYTIIPKGQNFFLSPIFFTHLGLNKSDVPFLTWVSHKNIITWGVILFTAHITYILAWYSYGFVYISEISIWTPLASGRVSYACTLLEHLKQCSAQRHILKICTRDQYILKVMWSVIPVCKTMGGMTTWFWLKIITVLEIAVTFIMLYITIWRATSK